MGLASLCKAQRFASTTSIATDAFVATNFWPSGTLVYVVDQEIWRRTTQNWGVGAAFSSITSVPSGGTAISSNANEIIQNVAGTVQGQSELIYDATPENFIIGNHTLTNTNFNGSIIQGGGIDLLGTGEIRDAISMGLNHVLNAGSGTIRWAVQLGEQHTFVQTTGGNLANSYAIGGFNNTVNGGNLNFRSSGFIGGNGNTMTNAVNETNSAMGLNLRSVTISNPVSETVYTNHLNIYNGVTPVAGAQTDHMLGVQSDGDVIRYLVNQVPVASAAPGAGQDGQVLEWDNTAGNWVYATAGGTAITSNPNELIQNVAGTVQGQPDLLYDGTNDNLQFGTGNTVTATDLTNQYIFGNNNTISGGGDINENIIIGYDHTATANPAAPGIQLLENVLIGSQYFLTAEDNAVQTSTITRCTGIGGFNNRFESGLLESLNNQVIIGGTNNRFQAASNGSVLVGGSAMVVPNGAGNFVVGIGLQTFTFPTGVSNTAFFPKLRLGQGLNATIPDGDNEQRILSIDATTGEVEQSLVNSVPIAATSPGASQDGQVLQWDNTASDWVYATPGGGGGGEANTASNLGTGEGLFTTKSGVDLPFKSLVGGTNLTLTSDANTVTMNVDNSFWQLTGTSSIATSATIEATGAETIELRNQDAANDRASILISEISSENAITMVSENSANNVNMIMQPASIAFDFGNPGSNSGGSLSMIDNAFNTGSLVYTDNGSTKIGIRYDAVYDFANLDDRSLVQKQHLENINLVAEISLTNSQLLSLNTTPVEAIPAPGAGQAILIIGQPYLSYDHVTSDFGPNDDILLQVGTTSHYRFLNALSGAVDSFTMGDVFPVTAVARTAIENQAVNITAQTGDPTLGGGTAKVFITYRIVTL